MTVKETTVSDEEAQTGEPESEIPPVVVSKEEPTKAPPVAKNESDTTEVELGGVDFQLPEPCYCPITKQIMSDPVVHPNGESYEKEAIMSRQSDNSLMTFYPNRALRAYIDRERERMEEVGSINETIRRVDNSLRNGWDRFVERAALPFGETKPLPDGMSTLVG